MTEVLVVGAGPAGLAAAAAALAAGAEVTLLDAARDLGGQYWRHLPPERASAAEAGLHHGWRTFRDLTTRVRSEARVLTGAQVWSVEPDPRAGVGLAFHVTLGVADAPASASEPRRLTPDAVVLATGAHDRTLPFPGWDLPGVFTGGAAQVLAKSERVRVGERVLVAGAGPFLLPVAASVLTTGAAVAAVLEAASPRALASGWLARPWRLLGAAHKGGEAVGYARALARHRVPYRPGWGVVAAHGTDAVSAVTIARLGPDWSPVVGTERRLDVDAVCVTHGFTPRLELAIACGAALTPGPFVAVDAEQATSVPGVWAAGEITGIAGADAALAEGEIAGRAAAGGRASDVPAAVRARRRAAETGRRIDAAHRIGSGWVRWLTEDTVLCRCEDVTAGAIERTARETRAEGLRSLKLTTRAGLGACQARVCGRTLEELLVRHAPAGALLDGATTDRRPVVTPQRLGTLIRAPGSASAPEPAEDPASTTSSPRACTPRPDREEPA